MLNNFKTNIFVLIFAVVFTLKSYSYEINDHRIAVLVNEEIITTYDIVQRMKINSIIQGIDITPENNQLLANSVVDELIHEIVKSEKVMEYKIKVDKDELIEFESNFLKRTKFTKEELTRIFELNDVKYADLENLLTNQLSWQKLIGALYYRLTSASEIEINEVLERNQNITYNQAERIVIQKQLDLKSSKLFRDILNEATIEYK